MKKKNFNKLNFSFNLNYYIFKNKFFSLFRKVNFYLKKFLFFKKVFISVGLFSKCFLILPKHFNFLVGSFRVTRKLYNSSIALKKLKR